MSERIYGVATKAWQIVAGCDERMPCAEKCWAKNTVHRLGCSPNEKIRRFHEGLTVSLDPEMKQFAWTGEVRLNEAHLTDPLRWRGKQVIAVGYHGDWMRLSTEERDRILGVEALTHRDSKGLTFLHLTKLTDEQVTYFSDPGLRDRIEYEAHEWMDQHEDLDSVTFDWPLPNVFLGFSASNQSEFDARVPHVLKLAAQGWKTWVSLEPLIGPVDMTKTPRSGFPVNGATVEDISGALARWQRYPMRAKLMNGIDAIALGGESGKDARPMHPDWVCKVRDDCAAAGVPFMFKQWGDWEVATGETRAIRPGELWLDDSGKTAYPSSRDVGANAYCMRRVGKKLAGRTLDGRTHDELAWEVANG